ncbi:MAG: GTP-binding protein [Actinomycetota bacterium]
MPVEPPPEPVAVPGIDTDVDVDEIAPWDGRRVPVTLVGGYLGAGKTTTINELLARTDRPIAVLVNDVGSVNVDASLVKRRHGDTIELTDGCVCCSLSRGLVDAFDALRARPEPPDQVIVELSGVADPRRVMPWASSTGFRLDAVVVLVDADQFEERHADPIVGPTLAAQLEAADVIVLSKTDTVPAASAAALTERLRALRPDTPVFIGGTANATAAFLQTGTRRPRGFADVPDPQLFDAHQVSTRPLPDPVTTAELYRILDALPDDVLRAKAIARTDTDVTVQVHVVGSRTTLTPLPPAETQDPTDLVIIRPRG